MTTKVTQILDEIKVSISGPSIEDINNEEITKYNYSFTYFNADNSELIMSSDIETEIEFEDSDIEEDMMKPLSDEVSDKKIELISFEYNWAEGKGSANICLRNIE